MELEETRNVLQQALDQQLLDNKVAVDAQRRLKDQQITYANEARGTLYSGIPTWQRASLAVETAPSIAKLNQSYAKNKVNIWDSVQGALDQINAYNEAAKELGGGTTSIPTLQQTTTESAPFLLNGEYYKYVDGKLTKV